MCKLEIDRLLQLFISQINKFQTEGVTINVDNSEKKVNFALLHILGDNLGLYAIFGFTTSFNSNYSCRICLVNTTIRKKQVIEEAELLRNVENYTTDVMDQNHGIIENCVFNSITNVHVTKNISVT